MRLHKSQVGLGVFSRLLCHLRLFPRRKLRLERFCDLLGEIALDRKNVDHVAIVIACPNVFIAICVDQLDVHTHLISGPAHTSFQDIGDAKRFAYVAKVCRLISVLHHRSARNHLQVAYPRQTGKQVILNTVGEVSVLWIVA